MTFRKSLLASSILIASLGLAGCGGSSDSSSPTTTPTTPTTPTNTAPTAVTLTDAQQVFENAANLVVGTLAATDADANETFQFTVADERFIIEGTTLKLAAGVVLDYEQTKTITVPVTVKDSANNSFTANVEVAVVDEKDYDFVSRFDETKSSVDYSGQIARHILIKELFNYIKGDFKAHAASLPKAELLVELNKFYKIAEADYATIWEDKALTLTTTPGAKQQTLFAVSKSHKDLSGKIAGNDKSGQHKAWNEDTTTFVGWSGLAVNTPEGLVEHFFDLLADRALSQAITPNGKEVASHYVTADGLDLNQLIQKFLYGAVAFSQGADDYLDAGKGLDASNTQDSDKSYTKLEHQWDEGFGYFGAARNYLSYTDLELAAKSGRDEYKAGYQDTNLDGQIDFNSEYNFGNSTNAAKRDIGAEGIDLTKEAFEAFFAGRKLIADTQGELTAEQKIELEKFATTARVAWEKSIVGTVIHYINDSLKDLNEMKDGTYSAAKFEELAKHWSEMKGFALNMQFNPVSPLTDAQFAEVHALMGIKPVLGTAAEIEAYSADLIKARNILRDAYGFTESVAANW